MKPYNVTGHAIDRVVERFTIQREHAKNHLVSLMQTAVHQGTTGTGRVFDHYRTNTRLILSRDSDTVITVYTIDSEKDLVTPVFPKAIPTFASVSNFIIDKARATIHREIAKARRQFTREFRSLSESQALIQIEIAELTLNKVRCRAPLTQLKIEEKISILLDSFDELGKSISRITTDFEKIKVEAEEFLQIKS